MNAQQMQELCLELVGALEDMLSGWRYIRQDPLHREIYGVGWGRAQQKAESAIANAKAAFNPTPSAQGCVETAATVPSSDGTGETVKALGVGPCCPVCGAGVWVKLPSGEDVFHCGKCSTVECSLSEHLAITRAKQLADALDFIRFIAESGGTTTECGLSCNGSWCAEQARSYLREVKERTA